MLPSLAEYERLIYTLSDRHPFIRHSTLVVVRHGPAFAELTGTLEFDNDIRLTVWEDLNFARGIIQGYSYAVSRGEERLYWYVHSLIQMIFRWRVHFLTTSIFRRTSNVTMFLFRAFRLTSPICHF